MKGVNPRFILRQWVLEEVIADIEKAGWENVGQARQALARVLDVSLHWPTYHRIWMLMDL